MERKELLIDIEENPKKAYQWFLFAMQHVLAVLVATVTVPLIIPGMPVAAAMLSAGLGTLFYLIVTKRKSPVFLSSNFAYVAPISSALAVGGIKNAISQDANYGAVMIGMLIVGIIYVLMAIIIKFCGTKWIDKVLPPIVIGPTIMVIGLSLATNAVRNMTSITSNGIVTNSYNLIALLCGFIALFVTAFSAHYGKDKMMGLIPFLIGILGGYICALIFTLIGYTACGNEYFKLIDFQPFIDKFSPENLSFASFFNYLMFIPDNPESFMFLRFEQLAQFDWSSIGQILVIFIPISFVSICEHIGDHENLGNIVGRDLLRNEPGISRTLIGDGVATTISGQLSGLANTTYGESIAIIGTTKIASANVLLLASILMCVFSLFTPFTVLLTTIPPCVIGGVSLILYGYISMSGMRVIANANIDFDRNKNMFIVSIILISGIGGFTLKFGDPNRPVVEITPVAVAMILGILFNLIMRERPPKEMMSLVK